MPQRHLPLCPGEAQALVSGLEEEPQGRDAWVSPATSGRAPFPASRRLPAYLCSTEGLASGFLGFWDLFTAVLESPTW